MGYIYIFTFHAVNGNTANIGNIATIILYNNEKEFV